MLNSGQNIGDSPFKSHFNAEVRVASPGRINLIGEHTDYNLGYVMPTAIDKKIFFELKMNGTPTSCTILSESFNSWFSFDLNNFKKSSSTWENYILGVVNEIQKKGRSLQGFDCKINSELPIGAGISSSAALECGLAAGLNELFDLDLSKQEIVTLSQAAENNFVGSNCGIMDQFASVMSKKGHLILLDCLSLEAEFIPANLRSCKVLLINTKVSHSLADGEYNTRRRECETALSILQKNDPALKSLRDVNAETLGMYKSQLSEKEYNRILFVLQENQRVLTGSELLKTGNLQDFGKLMYQSHKGLRDLYEVSCRELDFLVKFTEAKEFIYGARMMGGGFGGCTINIIEEDKIAEFTTEVSQAYNAEFGITPDLITVTPGEGTIVQKL